MPRPASKQPTDLELEILKVLWDRGALPVRDVREALSGFRELAHTSVLTIMNIMTEKGYLKRTRLKNTYIYAPVKSREATVGRIVGDVVDRVFDGSTAAAVVHLLEHRDIDEAELARLRALIDRLEKGDAS